MANAEHLTLLKQGVDVWNVWRRRYASVTPDLSGTTLAKINLPSIDLSHAYLMDVNLRGANLAKANLHGTDLRMANLTRVDFSGADFTRALFLDTVFADANLAGAKGLDTCRHNGPSHVDHRTFQRSGGELPNSFLRGCGLPDQLNDFLWSLFAQRSQFCSCFISYAGADEDFAHRLYEDLSREGVHCWFAPVDMKIGDKIRTRIDEVIQQHDKMLLVLSRYSVCSQWVEKEVETAFYKEREQKITTLFPVRLDDEIVHNRSGWAADIKRLRHIGDFRNWRDSASYQKSFSRLMRDLQMEVEQRR